MTVYAARWVVPIDSPPIYDAEVIVEQGRIEAVRQAKCPASEKIDFGNSILLPGLINAHTHLEYTALRGFLEDVSFFPWIRALTEAKTRLTANDWFVSAKLGALECLASGITTIGDNTDAGVTMDAARECGLRGRIYQEFFCIDHRTSVKEVLDTLADKVESLTARTGSRLSVGVSPHATYTVNAGAFAGLLADERLNRLPISIHAAESPAETALIEHGTGPFAEMFDRRGIEWSSPNCTPTRYLYDQNVLTNRTLLIHSVHQSGGDLDLVQSTGSAIIHCPKSNAKLGAGIAPLSEWLKRDDLLVGIGTDSAVSNNSIDLFEEMRFALLLQRGVTESVEPVNAKSILELATIRGAAAMGLSETVGSLTPGKRADLIAVGLDGFHSTPATDPVTALLYSARASDVRLTVIDGQVCYHDGNFPDILSSDLKAKAFEIRQKIS